MLYTALIIGMFVLILGSLFSGLYFVMHDDPKSKRGVKALAIRIGLSMLLFLLLMGGYYFGLIPGRA